MVKKKNLEGKIGFCDFRCKHANEKKTAYAACLASNGPWCKKHKKYVQKSTPCGDYSPVQ